MDGNVQNSYLEGNGEGPAFKISVKGTSFLFFFTTSPGESYVIYNILNVYISQCFRISCL